MASEVFASERVYINAAGELVGNDDPGKLTLIAAAGAPVPARYVAAYQAYSSKPAVLEVKAVKAAPQNKAVSGPASNK